MTAREKSIWLWVGIILVISLGYHFGYRNWEQLQATNRPGMELQEAGRLLRAQHNIIAREQAVAKRLKQLQSRYYEAKQRDDAKLQLLDLVESIALKSGLTVQLKNTVTYSQEELGISLEGTTGTAELVRFLHQLITAPVVLQVKRLQLHNVKDKKALNYQITISTWVID
ncbi:MAG TPA: hypothetical protein VEC37_13160 [Bacillota bacterium]|nr:hypothetical protein [Bacillota bacterium]